MALTNMQFIKDIEALFNSFVQVMATAIDAQTPYNANHTHRVALLAQELAQKLNDFDQGIWAEVNFDQDRCAQLVMAAWMHDIGKIATPLKVMNKATRLEERLELIHQRLDFIWAQAHNTYLEQKLIQAADPGSLEVNPEAWWQEQQAIITQARKLIDKVNDPGIFVSKELAAQLDQIASRKYHENLRSGAALADCRRTGLSQGLQRNAYR